MPQVRPKVPHLFISSTLEDLGEFRAAARDAAIDANFFPAMQEYFPAGNVRPLAECIERVRECDVLAVIVAYRYGWVPTDQSTTDEFSITWLECQAAVSAGKEVIAFLVDEKCAWPDELRDDFALTLALRQGQELTTTHIERVSRDVRKLKEFKAWLNSRAVTVRFQTCGDLKACFLNALHACRLRNPQLGGTASSSGPNVDPRPYLQSLLKENANLDIKGLNVGDGKVHSVPIEELFITLRALHGGERRKAPTKGATDKSELHELAPRHRPLVELLAERMLVVIGDPGAGKTTFLRRVAGSACRMWLEGSADAAQWLGEPDVSSPPFPVLVRAFDLARHLARDLQVHSTAPVSNDSPEHLFQFLGRDAATTGLEAAFFRQKFTDGKVLLLVDGLDETADRVTRGDVSKLMLKVARVYDQCRVVVTSRPAVYEDEVVLAGFTHARIEPLDDSAIESFLDSWCRCLHRNDKTAGLAHRDELLGSLRARPDIRRLVRNPVMLTALAVVHWNDNGRLPEQRADLYESIITWLARAREKKVGRVTAEVAVRTLQELALAMQRHANGRQVQVPRHWAAEALCQAGFKAPKDQPAGGVRIDDVAAAEQFLSQEEIDSGIIVGRGHEVRFWHLTFQEYLTARAIGARSETEQRDLLLGTKPAKRKKRGSKAETINVAPVYRAEWHEVSLLLAGVLHQQGTDKVDGLMKWVIDELPAQATLAQEARVVGLLGACSVI